jgi:hypothetical protein
MPEKKVIAARNLIDWTKLTTRNNENQTRKSSFLTRHFLSFPSLQVMFVSWFDGARGLVFAWCDSSGYSCITQTRVLTLITASKKASGMPEA